MFIADNRGAFSPENTIRCLHDYPITTFCGPPTAYRPLVLPEAAAYLRANRPMALEHCVGAGEPLNPEVIRQWKSLTGTEIRDGYGQVSRSDKVDIDRNNSCMWEFRRISVTTWVNGETVSWY